jgi:hypothetical protein
MSTEIVQHFLRCRIHGVLDSQSACDLRGLLLFFAAHVSGREIKEKAKLHTDKKVKALIDTHVPVESPSLEVTSFARDFPMLTRLTLTPIHLLHDGQPPSSTTPHHPARFRKVL